MTGLEANTLLLTEWLLLVLSLTLVVWLAPIAIEISRTCPGVPGLTATALVVRLATFTGRGKLETAGSSARHRASIAANCHRLAPPVTTTSADVSSSLETESLRGSRGIRLGLIIGCRWILGSTGTGSRSRELKAGCRSLLLRELGSLLGFRQGERVSALVTTTRRAATATAVVGVLILLIAVAWLVVIGVARCTG